MRGPDGVQEGLFTMARLDDFVPADHPLRAIQALVNQALGGLNGLFNATTMWRAQPRNRGREPESLLTRRLQKSRNTSGISSAASTTCMPSASPA